MPENVIIILISANTEWRTVKVSFPGAQLFRSSYGEGFYAKFQSGKIICTAPDSHDVDRDDLTLVFIHGGWGKIAAAGSTQYAIDRWNPKLIINLGTCGGFAGFVERGEIILVEKTIVYDIIEQMGDYDDHIAHYTSTIDLDWLAGDDPHSVRRTVMVSADKDLMTDEIDLLHKKYAAVVGDWESGAIAWVAQRNQVSVLILRGVTDLVSINGGEAYANHDFYANATREIMLELISILSAWIERAAIR